MIKILILEDNKDSQKALESIVKKISDKIVIFTAETISQAQQTVEAEAGFALFLLDINLNAKNVEDIAGMDFAREIRKRYEYEIVPIIFVTSILSMELTSYREFQCYRYITKPFDEKEVTDIIGKVLSHTQEEDMESLVIKKDGINYKILCSDIIYIQAVPRGLKLCLKKEEVEVKYLTLKQILPKLSSKNFLQCHRMFIVNRTYIEYLDHVNKIIKLAGTSEIIEIGVTYKAKLKEWMNE